MEIRMTTDFRRSKSADFGAKAIKAAAIFSVAAVLCILFAIVISIIIDGVLGDVDYDRYREDMLTEIADRRGEYDPQSIVLEQTEEPEARALAERLGAELRMTDNGHFAVLTLPESVTIEDVFKNDEFLTDLPGMSIDYMARISEIEASEEGDGLRNPQPPQYTVTDGSYTLQKYLEYIKNQVREVYSRMLSEGSTTVWETKDGKRAFDGAGSLCHGWSAFVVKYLLM
jgi:hypothetical protein